jgi:hypothetical protein
MRPPIFERLGLLWTCIIAVFLLRTTFAEGISVERRFDSNDLSVLAGLHVVYSWPGGTIPQELYDLTKDGKVGGVIIFCENVNDDLPSQVAKLQNVYKQSPGYIGHPLLIVTDQEGGIIVRLPGGPKKSEKDIGSSLHPVAAASRAGVVAATACKDYNVNGELLHLSSLEKDMEVITCRKPRASAGCLSQRW